jgi:HEAT repeat protein
MKNRKLWRGILVVASIAAFGVFTFSGYELVRIWRVTNAVKVVMPGDLDALARFAPLLDDYNPWIRNEAAQALGRIGPAAKVKTPELLRALKADSSPAVRTHAAWALGRIDAGAPAIPGLIEALDDDNSEVRRYAANALMLHGPLAEPAVAKLIERIQIDEFPFAYAAALGEIGPPAKAAIPHLIAAMRKETSLVRAEYAQALGKFGPEAKDAIPDLLPMRLDSDPDVRRIATAALKNIDPNIKGP